MKTKLLFGALIAVQGLCAFFFVSDIVMTVFGFRSSPISWQTREFLELGAGLGLVLGLVFGWVAFRRMQVRSAVAEESVRVMQSAFQDHMEERFKAWALTPAECDVALFSLKGLSLQEIAEARETSAGTVKAQSNAIYRKAGVSGRAQLLSLFIDDLLAEA